jgi:hypothetical protein
MLTEYAAFIEPVENQFRATASLPFELTVFGATEKEALERLDNAVRERLQQGGHLVRRRLTETQDHPLARFAGDLSDDPLASDWLAAMATYRQDAERDPNY